MVTVPEYIEKLTSFFSSFPGIGSKSAIRLAMHFIDRSTLELEQAILTLREVEKNRAFCQNCHFFASKGEKLCEICSNVKRTDNQIIVVESRSDVLALEEMEIFKGKYHVLNGLISPLKNIVPSDLNISDLLRKIKTYPKIGDIENGLEVILAIDTNIEGEATITYLTKQIEGLAGNSSNIRISALARGLPSGANLDYTDKDTLQKSYFNRQLIS